MREKSTAEPRSVFDRFELFGSMDAAEHQGDNIKFYRRSGQLPIPATSPTGAAFLQAAPLWMCLGQLGGMRISG
jgi:hypothetical protein